MKGVLQVFAGFFLEGGFTAWMAKIIGLILIDKTRRSLFGVNGHFANRINSQKGVGGPKAGLYNMRYHRSEGLFCRKPPGDGGCDEKTQSKARKAKQDASGRLAKGQSPVRC